MRGTLLLALILSAFGICQAQYIPNQILTDTGTFHCPFDTSVTIKGITGITTYQTTNDEWDGPVDSSRCINVYSGRNTYGAYGYIVRTADIDTNHSVFLAVALTDTNEVLLQQNHVYSITTYINGHPYYGTACANGLCMGAIISIRIPDSSGTGYNHRYSILNGESDQFGNVSYQSCLVTEKFDSNVVDHIVYKFTTKNVTSNDSILFTHTLAENNMGSTQQIDSVALTRNIGPQHFSITYGDSSGYGSLNNSFLVVYKDSTYPDANHISLVEATPSPNTSNIDTLDIIVAGQFTNFLFQPFANLVGGHPIGDTINRHIVHYINNGGNTCMPAFVEKGFEHYDKFIYKSGMLMFDHPMSCLYFGKGGALEVAGGATFHYGETGKGMLLLKTGGTIIIGKGAELVIGNTVTMKEYYGEKPAQIYMTLNQGSKLTFAPGSHLENNLSIGQAMKLNIFMKGGILDDSGLSAEDKANINLIYDQPNAQADDNLKILGNPVQGNIQFSYLADQANTITVELIDLQGRTVSTQIMGCQNGVNYLQLPLNEGAKGEYILRITGANNSMVKKLVKL